MKHQCGWYLWLRGDFYMAGSSVIYQGRGPTNVAGNAVVCDGRSLEDQSVGAGGIGHQATHMGATGTGWYWGGVSRR